MLYPICDFSHSYRISYDNGEEAHRGSRKSHNKRQQGAKASKRRSKSGHEKRSASKRETVQGKPAYFLEVSMGGSLVEKASQKKVSYSVACQRNTTPEEAIVLTIKSILASKGGQKFKLSDDPSQYALLYPAESGESAIFLGREGSLQQMLKQTVGEGNKTYNVTLILNPALEQLKNLLERETIKRKSLEIDALSDLSLLHGVSRIMVDSINERQMMIAAEQLEFEKICETFRKEYYNLRRSKLCSAVESGSESIAAQEDREYQRLIHLAQAVLLKQRLFENEMLNFRETFKNIHKDLARRARAVELHYILKARYGSWCETASGLFKLALSDTRSMYVLSRVLSSSARARECGFLDDEDSFAFLQACVARDRHPQLHAHLPAYINSLEIGIDVFKSARSLIPDVESECLLELKRN